MSSYKSNATKDFVLSQTRVATRFCAKSASDIWRFAQRKRPNLSVQLVHFHLKNLTTENAVNRVGRLYRHPAYADKSGKSKNAPIVRKAKSGKSKSAT
jgi:hypothetical protein